MNIAARRGRQWTRDHDRHFGPFTYAPCDRHWRPFAFILDSGNGSGCHLRMQAFGHTLICEMPAVIKPWRKWVDLSRHDWAKRDDGSDPGYWDSGSREYGFSVCDGHLSVKLGDQTNDSSTTQDWGCFLPWKQWRQTAHRLYNGDGSLHADVSGQGFDALLREQKSLKPARFTVEDHDGELVGVSIYVEERESRLGTGLFKWIGYLRPRLFGRYIEMNFDKEVGADKGSWKGGMVGTAHKMLPGESAYQALLRFCNDEQRGRQGKYKLRLVS